MIARTNVTGVGCEGLGELSCRGATKWIIKSYTIKTLLMMSAHQEYGKASEVITYTAYGGSININHTAVICRPVSTSIIQLRIPEHT